MNKFYAITSSLANGSTEASLFIPPEHTCRIMPELIWLAKFCKVKDMKVDKNRAGGELMAYISFFSKEDAQEICHCVDKAIKEEKSLSFLYFMLKSSQLKSIKKEIAPVIEYIGQFGDNWDYGVYNFRNTYHNHPNSTIPENAINAFDNLVSPYF